MEVCVDVIPSVQVGYPTKCYTGRTSLRSKPPFTFYIPLLPEKAPLFLIPFFDKWYPFQISINHKMHLLALLGLFTDYINHKMHLLALLGLFTNYINHKMHLLALLGLFTNYINHKMHLLALLGLFTDYNDRFPYPFMYFN